MDQQLFSYLHKHRDTTDYYTHTSQLSGAVGKYKIEHNDYETFMEIYSKGLYTKKDKFIAGISEKPKDYMPVLGDIDISFSVDDVKEGETHFYKPSHVKHIVEIYMEVLKYVVLDWKPEHMICFVLEKSKPYKKDVNWKNGFHLHFPWLYLSAIDQSVHVEPRIIKRVETEEVFSDIGIKHSGQVIDKDIFKKHWLLYGSRKSADKEPYMLTKIFNHTCDEISLTDCFTIHSLYNVDEEECKLENDLEYYLPRLLSVNSLTKPNNTFSCRSDIEITLRQKLTKAKDNKQIFENMKLPEIISVTKELMQYIDPKRADHHDTWMHVGWTLYNITDGCDEGLQIWIDFSKNVIRRKHVTEARCMWEWGKMEKRGLTLGCLKFMARNDSPITFKEYEEKQKNLRIQDCLKGGQNSLAKQLYDIVGDVFVLGNVEKRVWYEFKHHRWTRSDTGITLRQRITTEIIPRFNNYHFKSDDFKESEGEEKTKEETVRDGINKLLKSLNSAGFKKGIMTECEEWFYNEDFLKKLDSNPYLLGFTNGVLDLKAGIFRDGDPKDYVSMNTGYDFKKYSWDDPEIQEVQTILIKLFPDDELRQYFIEYCARLLKGGNDAKTFNCWTGVGDNGKSIAIELIEKALGMYAIKFPTSLLTGKRGQSSAASPELARTHGVRFSVLQEPDGSDTINAGILKEMSGNDSFYVRGLFKDGQEIKPMFKLVLVCNKLPRLAADDQATWNRVRVLPYESRFPKNNGEVPETWEEQLQKKIFYRDTTLSEKLDDMKTAFMWMMFETYKRCNKHGWMTEPRKVMDATDKYRETNDYFLQFVAERCKYDGRNSVVVHLNEVYADFKSWFNMSMTGVKCPNKKDLQIDLDKRWGPNKNGRYLYWRLRTIEDDEEEGKAQIFRAEDKVEDEDW